jgi:beta-lactamase class A
MFTVIPLLMAWFCAAAPTSQSLEARLAPLAKAHKGKVAIAVKDLKTGQSYYLGADEVMPTASLIKLPVMIEVYQQVAEGKVKLSDMVTLHDSDKVPGSGILTYHFSEGATFPLRDAVRLMIAYSDNTATNLILDRIGVASTSKRMTAWGFPNTRINAKVYRGKTTSIDPARTKKYGLGSTTAREMVELLEKLYRGKLVSPAACKEMIGHLKQCQDKDKIKRFLPAKIEVADKTGAVSDVRTDAGILYLPSGPVVLCVLTAHNEDRRWDRDNAGNLLIAHVAQEVYRYFGNKTGKGHAPAIQQSGSQP